MRSGEATAESGLQRVPVQIASNEDDLTLSLGGVLPGAVGFAFKQHVDALEDESVGRIPKVQNALHAEDVLAFGLQEVAQPGIQLFGIEFPHFWHKKVSREWNGKLAVGTKTPERSSKWLAILLVTDIIQQRNFENVKLA